MKWFLRLLFTALIVAAMSSTGYAMGGTTGSPVDFLSGGLSDESESDANQQQTMQTLLLMQVLQAQQTQSADDATSSSQ